MKDNKINLINENEFRQVISKSRSIGECFKEFNIPTNYGQYYVYFHKRVTHLNINTEHFRGKAWAKNTKLNTKHPTEDIFKLNGVFLSNSHLKKRYISDFRPEYKCSECSLTNWLDKPINLHLDHINGNREDNRPENLRFLCPNCHSQTPTYCRKKV